MTNMKVSAMELAAVLGVNIRTVQRLTQEGVIEALPDPADKRKKVFDLTKAVPAFVEHKVGKAAGKERSERIANLEEQKLAAEVGLKTSQRDLHQLKTEIASGKDLPVEQIQLDYEQFFVVLKKFLTQIPTRISGMIAPHVDVVIARSLEKEVSDEIDSLLRTFVVAGEVKP